MSKGARARERERERETMISAMMDVYRVWKSCCGWLVEGMGGWMVGWLDGWMVGWLDGWMDGWKVRVCLIDGEIER